MPNKTLILKHEEVQRKLVRIAHQLHEANFEEDGIILVGIAPRGITLAKRLRTMLEQISEIPVDLVEMKLDKDKPLEKPIALTADVETLRGKVVVLVDDVLMSGRTMMHAAGYLIQVPLKKLTTVVLVDRRHRTYPIRADIVGMTLSTTVQEHIRVELGKKDSVHLE